jgi:sulfoxide reductase heme-binding subunit YedZ
MVREIWRCVANRAGFLMSPRLLTWVAIIVCGIPLGYLAWQLASGQLDPDPAKYLMQGTGGWALRGLVLVLLAAPLARHGWGGLFRYRRVLGVAVFMYASVHLLLFAQVYVGWDAELLMEELKERPYVLVGFAAWVLFLPLALTSTDAARRWLGRRWRLLHRLVYPAAALAWFHLYWLARSDIAEALIYGALIAVLLVWRLRRWRLG